MLCGREDPWSRDVFEVAADTVVERVLRRPPQRRCHFLDVGVGRPVGKRPPQFRVAQDEIDGLVLGAERRRAVFLGKLIAGRSHRQAPPA